jgi:hypothetical protein
VGIQKNFSLQNNQQWNVTFEHSLHTTSVVSLAVTFRIIRVLPYIW